MKKIILASTSPRRKQLLEQVGIKFDIEPSSYEEDMTLDMSPIDLAKHLSLGKAQAVAENHKGEAVIVIGADTFIAYKDKVLGKPHTVEKAKEMLQMLNGQKHQVMTGYALVDCSNGETISDVEVIDVYFRDLPEEEIDAYIATGEPLDKAGAYAIQEKGALLVSKIYGDYFALVGLPVGPVVRALNKLNVIN